VAPHQTLLLTVNSRSALALCAYSPATLTIRVWDCIRLLNLHICVLLVLISVLLVIIITLTLMICLVLVLTRAAIPFTIVLVFIIILQPTKTICLVVS
jgi:hypothetical protein